MAKSKSGTKKLTELERMQIWRRIERKWRIPSVYMEALSKGESNWTSDAVTGSYVGLLQVGPEVLEGFNKANKTDIPLSARFDPDINANLAAWQLRTIADMYTKSGIPELVEDFNSMEWIAMLTAGWNSGYSKKAGVLKVAKYIHENRHRVSHASLYQFAKLAGGTRHLQNATKRRWQRGVAVRTFRVREGQPI